MGVEDLCRNSQTETTDQLSKGVCRAFTNTFEYLYNKKKN